MSRIWISRFALLFVIAVAMQATAATRVANGFIGMALPSGDFKSTSATDNSAGYAKTGFVFGIESSKKYVDDIHYGGLFQFAINSLDKSELERQFGTSVTASSWKTLWFLGKGGIDKKLNEQMVGFGDVYLGLLYGIPPDVTASNNAGKIKTESAMALAYGFGFGVKIENKYSLGFRYLTSEPDYKVTTESGGGSSSGTYTKGNAMINLTAGYQFKFDF